MVATDGTTLDGGTGLPGTQHDWRDRLVELHVLAANGDLDAAAAAEAWLASDQEARAAWNEVQRTCDELHRAPTDV